MTINGFAVRAREAISKDASGRLMGRQFAGLVPQRCWGSVIMLKIKSRIAAFCGASLLMAGTALAADVKVAAISGYFAQGFGQSIVAGLNKAKDDFGVEVKLIDTGNRALDYEEQFNNVAKDGEYDLVFVMGWELVDALTKAAGTD